jgi:outer membrane biosynthesis protein TonB
MEKENTMEIVCKTCKKPFNANPIEVASASVNFSLGRKHIFYCDHCKAENPLTKEEFEAIKEGKTDQQASWKPVAPPPQAKPAPKPAAAPPQPKPVAKPVAKPASVTPRPDVVQPAESKHDLKPAAPPQQPKNGTVVVRSLRVRKDHSTSSEVVEGLAYGNKVEIISIWTDGKNTWAQLGPDRWAAIEYNGEKMIEVA